MNSQIESAFSRTRNSLRGKVPARTGAGADPTRPVGRTQPARADLHERFADWLEERGTDLVELDEILGHHLEQAARYKAELEQPDAALGERAAQRLTAAGRRALGRGDDRAAASLLERSLELTRPLRLDVQSMYFGTGPTRFFVRAFPVKLGNQEMPPPPPWGQ